MKKTIKFLIIILTLVTNLSWTNNFRERTSRINNIQNNDKYKIIKIGEQEWMSQNLDVEKYRNGNIIPHVQNDEEWKKLKTGAWCYYENKTENGIKYGKLYNWFAINDKRGLAPKGWHIPTDSECEELILFLVEKEAGGKMKTTTGWDDYHGENGNGTNESGFNGLPGGDRGFNGTFSNFGGNGEWWTSTADGQKWAKAFYISWNDPRASREGFNKQNGCSVRCIKNK